MKKLSKQQLEVMKTLWNSKEPLLASDIVKSHPKLNINTVQACLRVLIKANIIEVADIVYSGTVLSRRYRPLISKEEYFGDIYSDLIGDSSDISLIASFISTKTNLEELKKLEEMIHKRRKELGEE